VILESPVDLPASLDWYSPNAIKSMARARSDRWRDGRTKGEYLALLREALFDSTSIRRAVASCDALSREALALIKRKDGAMAAAALRGQLGTWHPEIPPEQVNRALGELVRHALAFWQAPSPRFGSALHDVLHPATDNPQAALLVSPPEILDFVVLDARLTSVALRPLRAAEAQGPDDGLRLVHDFLHAVEAHSPRILRSGAIGARDRAAIAQAIGIVSPDGDGWRKPISAELTSLRAIDFLRLTLDTARLIAGNEDRQLRPTAAALRFSTLGGALQAKLLLDAWLAAGENELFHLAHLRCERRPNVPKSVPDDEQARHASRFVVDTLADSTEAGFWYDAADLSAAIRQLDVEFLVSWRDPSPYHWAPTASALDRLPPPTYVGISLDEARGRSRSLTMGADWDLVEGAFVRALIQGPLSWLGLVESQLEAGSKVVFRLTTLGRQVLSGVPDLPTIAADTLPRDALVVQPNFELIVFDADDRAALLYQIDRFAQRLSADRLAIYHLTRESLTNGLQLGLRIEEILDLLASAARQPLPQNVVYTLRDWARQLDEVRWLRNCWLLEAPDAATFDRWLAEDTVAAALERRISPTVGLMAAARAADVARALWLLGADVAVVDANDPIQGVASLEDETTLHLERRDANLYVVGLLGELAEEVAAPNGSVRFRLTQETTRRAVQAGFSVEQIQDALVRITATRVPEGTRVRVKGWAAAYGAVALGEVAIFVAPDADAYREIRGDPELGQAFIVSISPTAGLVYLDALGSLRRALLDRGIEVVPFDPQRLR
jgi:hypothetical protein